METGGREGVGIVGCSEGFGIIDCGEVFAIVGCAETSAGTITVNGGILGEEDPDGETVGSTDGKEANRGVEVGNGLRAGMSGRAPSSR